MPSYSVGSLTTPFGVNVYLRSTQDVKTESYTVAKDSVPATTIDGYTGQKVLQKGTVMAKITSGPDVGKIGPYRAGATDGRQTAANIVGFSNTFLPWQLMERDVEIAVAYEASVVQVKCIELDSGGLPIALTNTTRDAMRSTTATHFMFH